MSDQTNLGKAGMVPEESSGPVVQPHETPALPNASDPANQFPSGIPSPTNQNTWHVAETSSTTPSEKPIRKGRGGPRINSGRPRGIHTPLRTKKTYNAEELADLATAALIEGKGTALRHSPKLGQVSQLDRDHIARITGTSVEVFNEHMANRLRTIADKAAQRIEEKLDSDQFKSGELGFILSVAHDKRLSLDGSRALNNASVNIQVNNFGTAPKDQLLTELDGMTNVTNSHLSDMDSSSRTQKVS